jgi:carotenoid cleavage dioxygenase
MWWDESRDCSEIVVQDAQDFAARPVARIKLNQRVPMGFHGNWVSAG